MNEIRRLRNKFAIVKNAHQNPLGTWGHRHCILRCIRCGSDPLTSGIRTASCAS